MNAGDTAFILLCAAFVFIMTPGLAFFYGGMVRRKNVGNTMMQCVFIMGVSVIMWVLVGYALSFGGNHAGIIGGAKWFGFNGVGMKPGPYADTIPNLAFAAFQMMFAMITPALITGSVAGRMKFKALVLFIILWSLIVYYPMAHMVWGEGGFLAEIGSVDFAGGNVVHITSGVSGLVLALTLGKRRGYDQGVYHVHNTPFVFFRSCTVMVWMVRIQCRKCSCSKWTCSTCIYDNICFSSRSSCFMDVDRSIFRRKNNFSRSFHRISYRTGSNHTGSRICSNVGSSDLWIISKPNLLLRCKTDQRKIKD